MKPLPFLLTLLLLTPLAHAQTTTTQSAPTAPPALYKNPTYHFSLAIPALTNILLPQFYFRGPDENGTRNAFSIWIQPQKTTRDQYLQNSQKESARIGMTTNSQKNLQIANLDAVLVDYQLSILKKPNRSLVLAAFAPDYVALISYSSSPENFLAHQAEFQPYLQTFNLGTTPSPLIPNPKYPPSTYINTEHNFAVSIPYFGPPVEKSTLALFQYLEAGDHSLTTITLSVDAPATRTDALPAILSSLTDLKATINSQKLLQVSNTDALLLDFTQPSLIGGPPHRSLNLKIFAKDHTYTILCTCQSPTNFPTHESQFHQCLDSFQLDPN